MKRGVKDIFYGHRSHYGWTCSRDTESVNCPYQSFAAVESTTRRAIKEPKAYRAVALGVGVAFDILKQILPVEA